jgi:hypothetical protein
MCWFLCANSMVHQWLRETVDDACRKAIELTPTFAICLDEVESTENARSLGEQIDARARTRVRTIQCAQRFSASQFEVKTWRMSSQLRHKPLEFIAKAWGRWLLWLRWRG